MIRRIAVGTVICSTIFMGIRITLSIEHDRVLKSIEILEEDINDRGTIKVDEIRINQYKNWLNKSIFYQLTHKPEKD